MNSALSLAFPAKKGATTDLNDSADLALAPTAIRVLAVVDSMVVLIATRVIERIPVRSVTERAPFVVNRLLVPFMSQSLLMLDRGEASAEDIDKAMTLGYGFPMGPLKLTDLVGLDVRLSIAEYLASTLGDRFDPPQLLRDKVAAGELGKKSGRGFYDWND